MSVDHTGLAFASSGLWKRRKTGIQSPHLPQPTKKPRMNLFHARPRSSLWQRYA